MYSRALFRVGAGGSVGALFLTSAHAMEHKKTMKVSELPLYGEPSAPKLEYVEERISTYRKHISTARQTIWEYYDSIKDTRDAVVTTYDKAYASVKDVLIFLREDNAIVPRVVFISISGLGGIIAGYRGGVLRKLIYASVGMSAAAAVCYPEQASQFTREGWQRLRTEAEKVVGTQVTEKTSSTEAQAHDSADTKETAQLQDTTTHAQEVVEAERAPGDQSTKADRELLTTRSSGV